MITETIKKLTATEGFRIAGGELDKKGRGKIRGIVRYGLKPNQIKRYTLTRNSDGHVVYRWGQIGSALLYTETSIVVFLAIGYND